LIFRVSKAVTQPGDAALNPAFNFFKNADRISASGEGQADALRILL
jgi:hypothetical protein